MGLEDRKGYLCIILFMVQIIRYRRVKFDFFFLISHPHMLVVPPLTVGLHSNCFAVGLLDLVTVGDYNCHSSA